MSDDALDDEELPPLVRLPLLTIEEASTLLVAVDRRRETLALRRSSDEERILWSLSTAIAEALSEAHRRPQ